MIVDNVNAYKNLEGDSFVVTKVNSGDDVEVLFTDTGYNCRARGHLVESGLVRDFTELEAERTSWVPHKEEFVTNSGQKFTSFSSNGYFIRITFDNTNYSTKVYLSNARAGKVKDPFEVSVYGQGYLGLPDKSLPYWRQALQLWQNMMKRCYSEKDSRGYLGRCFVDDRWKSFENFLSDIKNLEGFKDWVRGSKDPYYLSNLDKDFYKQGNEVYSRHYCRFLPQSYNKSLGKKGKTKKDWA